MSFYTSKLDRCIKFLDKLQSLGCNFLAKDYKNILEKEKSPWVIKVNYFDLDIIFDTSYRIGNSYINLDIIPKEDYFDYAQRYVNSLNVKKGEYVHIHGEDLVYKVLQVHDTRYIELTKGKFYNPSLVSYPTRQQFIKHCIYVLQIP